MRLTASLLLALSSAWTLLASPVVPAAPERRRVTTKHLRYERVKRQNPQPISSDGRGAPIVGGTNPELDTQNPDNLVPPATDNGVIVNLKWSFSDSHMRLLNGGWVREQTVTDLPPSVDIASVQQHLKQGAWRELHWHRVSEWGILTAGNLLIAAVDQNGENTVSRLNAGDVWYFPKGVGHTLQGLGASNEFILVFDDGNFDAAGTTFNVDDWIAHVPPDVLLKNFGLTTSDPNAFAGVPKPNPYIHSGTVSTDTPPSPFGKLTGASSYVFPLSTMTKASVPGGGGTFNKIDSTNFPIATNLAAAYVTLKPGALRELHWHPNADEWLYFMSGTARATVFLGNALARTWDFSAGDTAVFPDNSGHYIENTSETEELVWIEVYKSDRVEDISLTQWLALMPADIVAQTLNVSLALVQALKTQKQILVT